MGKTIPDIVGEWQSRKNDHRNTKASLGESLGYSGTPRSLVQWCMGQRTGEGGVAEDTSSMFSWLVLCQNKKSWKVLREGFK